MSVFEKIEAQQKGMRFYCSECRTWQTYGRTPFCMFCGSPMEVEDEKESCAS